MAGLWSQQRPATHDPRDYCPGVAFGQKSTLKTHIETVHEKRRDHVCGYCKGVAFGTASTLKAHISAIHLKIKRSAEAQSRRNAQ